MYPSGRRKPIHGACGQNVLFCTPRRVHTRTATTPDQHHSITPSISRTHVADPDTNATVNSASTAVDHRAHIDVRGPEHVSHHPGRAKQDVLPAASRDGFTAARWMTYALQAILH